LPANINDGLIEVVAAVDENLENLAEARSLFGLPADQCYSDVERALAEVIFAAIESARTGQTVGVQQYLKTTRQQLT
jgi:hypothetical protein